MTDLLRFPSPDPPESLEGDARRLWLELAPLLAEQGSLPPAAAAGLEIACQAHADWREHTARVRKEGAIVKGPGGGALQHPSVSLAAKAAETWRKFSKALKLDQARAADNGALPAFMRKRAE